MSTSVQCLPCPDSSPTTLPTSPGVAWRLRGLDRISWWLPALLVINAISRPYAGLIHDARLYAFQVQQHVTEGLGAADLFLRYGSQDGYSVFSKLLVPWIRIAGVDLGFFTAYLVSNTLFFLAFGGLLRALRFPAPVRIAALVYVAATPLPFGGLQVFHVHENFFTARTLASAVCLFGLERLVRHRFGVAFGLLVVALLVHPLMAVGSLGTGCLYLLFRWAPRRVAATTILGMLLVTVLVIGMPDVGRSLFGDMDNTWKVHIRAANPYCIPDLWRMVDHWAILLSSTLLATDLYRKRGRDGQRRFSAALLIVALGGYALTWVAAASPYALLLQGQPYRVLWLLQLMFVPIAVRQIHETWRRRDWDWPWMAIFLLAWMILRTPLLVTIMMIVSLVLWLRTACSGGVAGAALRIRGSHNPPVRRIIGVHFGIICGLAAACGTLCTFVALPQLSSAGEFVEPLYTWRFIGQVSNPLFAMVAIWVLAGRFRDARPWMVGIAMAVQCLAFGIPNTAWYRARYPTRLGDTEFVSDYLRSYRRAISHGGTDSTPRLSVHWSVLGPSQLWFAVGVDSYFSWQQLSGNMFHRATADEGHRRARCVGIWDARLYGDLPPLLRASPASCVEAIYGAHSGTRRPNPEDLLQLCRDPELDVAVLRYSIGGLFSATNGRWFIYDCRAIRRHHAGLADCNERPSTGCEL